MTMGEKILDMRKARGWNQEREKASLFMEMTENTSGAIKVDIEAMKRITAADLAKK